MSTEAPPGSRFATTRWSQVALAAGDSSRSRASLDWLCRAYWEPLRSHAARRGWKDAEDAVQDFWVNLIEKGALASADATRGRFRTWLLACLDHHLADRHDHRVAAKRGGGREHAELGAAEADGGAAPADPTLAFDRAWAEAMLERASERLRREAGGGEATRRQVRLERFLAANGDAAAYAAAAEDLGMSEGAIRVAVHRLRTRFRDCLRAEAAETLAEPTPQAIDQELGDLLKALRGA
jgi:RNA polymerase sigma-70 factor (ECF subfamily)